MQKLIQYTLLLATLVIGSHAFAQKTNTDTVPTFVGPLPDSTLFIIDSNSIEEKITILPITPEDIPCNNTYLSWNNDHVRVKKREITKLVTPPVTLNLLEQGKFVFPFKGKLISPYGYRGRSVHTGTDIKLNKGDTVRAAFDGVVRLSKRYGAYGKTVVIRHYNGLETIYSHLSKLNVNVNQKVKAGDIVGLGGRTGRATTDHLHFETRYLEEPFNSQHLIDYSNYSLYDSHLIISKNTFKMRSKPIHRKGAPAEIYEDDNRQSDSLDTLYSNNWKWPKPDSLKVDTTTKDSIKSNKQPQGIIRDTIKQKQVVIDSNTRSTKNPGNSKPIFTSKKQFIGPPEDTIANKKKADKPLIKDVKQRTHTVAAKETLYSISKKYNTTVAKLIEINKLPKNPILSIGQILIIPIK